MIEKHGKEFASAAELRRYEAGARKDEQPKLILPSMPAKVMMSPYKHPTSIGMGLGSSAVSFTRGNKKEPAGEVMACIGGGIMVTVKTAYGDVIVGIDPKALFESVHSAVVQFIDTRGKP